MHVDPSSHVPIYLQIVEGIRDRVAAGVLRSGEALPSLRALALQLHVNPNTVQRAYDELAREGLIYARRGRGLFVAQAGATAARNGSAESVRQTFAEGIRTAQAAGMGTAEIRKAFEASLRSTNRKRGSR